MAPRRTIDPYATLGISRDATPLQVARAHRRLAKRHHPDLHGDDDERAAAAEKMRRINEAWSILSNPDSRANYDRAHPTAGTPSGGHWAGTRVPIHPSTPTSTRAWASWRASAAETRAAPLTRRQPGEVPMPRTRRPLRSVRAPTTFRDSGWAAILAGAVMILILLGAIAVGRALP